MNERILELARQIWPDPSISHANHMRFAELIVREAAAFVSGSAEVYNQAEQDACVRASKGLMKHFGVE